MKKLCLPTALSFILVGVSLATPGQSGERLLRFEAGAGPEYAPKYEGSDEYELSAAGTGAPLALTFGGLRYENDGARGMFVGPSFRYLGKRRASDAIELAGIPDVDWALEIGLKAGMEWENAEVFGAVRKGLNGHTGWTGEIGADAILRPSDRVTVKFGPRVAFADDSYMSTYFSVPATATLLPAYRARGGVKSVGLKASVRYDLSDDWSVEGIAEYAHLENDAADSPIVKAGSADQMGIKVLFVRRFTFEF